MAGAVFGSVGAYAGSFAAGTFGWTASTWSQIGWTAGVLTANYLFAPDGPDIVTEGPRLDDLKVSTSTFGRDIPKVFGAYRISGNVIWALPINETRNEEREEEGKGGGGTSETRIWYTYDATFAVALCEGPISEVRKIWFGAVLVYDNGNSSINDSITIYTGTDTQTPNWLIESNKPDTPAYRNICYIVFENIQLKDYGNLIPNVTAEIVTTGTTVSTICTELSLDCGLSASDLNYAAGTDTVAGYVVSRSSSPRIAMEPILSAYEYLLIENDHKLELKKIQQLHIEDIPESELGVYSENKIEYNISQESGLFRKLSIKYANNQSDYQQGIQSVQRINVNATEERFVELPLALTDDHAKQLAEKELYNNWLQRQKYSFNLPIMYMNLVCGDVVRLNFDGLIRDVMLVKIINSEANVLECDAVLTDYNVYDSNSIADSTSGNSETLVEPASDSVLILANTPTLSNTYINTEGFYVAANGTNDQWRGCSVSSKSSDTDDFTTDLSIISGSVIGVTDTVLLDGPTHVWDLTNTVDVIIDYGSLFDSNLENVLNGHNYALVGQEVIQFTNASLVGNTYTLSTLLRGRRGTEHRTDTHVVGENFVLLGPVNFISKTINNNNIYASISFGLTDLVNHGSFLYDGENLKPFKVSALHYSRTAATNINLTWMRRSRYISSGFNTRPLSEDTELYSIDVIQASTVMNTYTSTVQSFDYTDVMATSDGVSISLAVEFQISQVSGVYGLGYSDTVIVPAI